MYIPPVRREFTLNYACVVWCSCNIFIISVLVAFTNFKFLPRIGMVGVPLHRESMSL